MESLSLDNWLKNNHVTVDITDINFAVCLYRVLVFKLILQPRVNPQTSKDTYSGIKRVRHDILSVNSSNSYDKWRNNLTKSKIKKSKFSS